MKASPWLVIVIGLCMSSAWAARPAALGAYVEDASVTHVTIAPQGNRVAYRVGRDGGEAVYVLDVASGEVLFSAQFAEAELRGLRFVDADHLLMLQHVPRWDAEYGDRGYLWLKMIDLQSDAIIEVRSNDAVPEFYARWYTWPPVIGGGSGSDPFVAGTKPPSSHWTLFKLSLEHGLHPHVEISGTEATIDWFAGAQPGSFIREEFDEDDWRHTITLYEGKDSRVLYEDSGSVRKIDAIGLTPDASALIYRSLPPGARQEQIFTMALADGATSGPLMEGVSLQALRDGSRRVLGFASGDFPSLEYRFLDADLGRRFAAVRQAFPHARVEFVTVSDDRHHLVVRVSEDWTKAYYLMFSPDRERPAVLAREQRKLEPADVGEPRVHSYVMADGTQVRALVTARMDTLAGGKAPALVLANWDDNTFSGGRYEWVAQYFASRGYIVVQPETRGARHVGAFSFQGREGWATTPVADADFVVSQLVAQELVDPARLCVAGFGFGGYTALMSAHESTHEYRCVASHRGYVDVHSAVKRMRENNRYDDPAMIAMQRRYGYATPDADDVRKRSPIEHASEYDAPLLLLYSDRDARSYETRAKDMEKAVEREGGKVDVVRLKSEDVRLRHADGREPLLRALADFVARHNPARD